jgi:hypothetical protein
MLLGDGCQAVGGARYLLNGSKVAPLIEAFSRPTLAQIFDRGAQLRNSLAMDLGESGLGDDTPSLQYAESIAPLNAMVLFRVARNDQSAVVLNGEFLCLQPSPGCRRSYGWQASFKRKTY